MDKLKMSADLFYGGLKLYANELKKQPMLDEGGRQQLAKVCERKHIQEAKQHSYMRRTYSNAYLNRSEDGKKMYLSDFDQLGARWVKDSNEIDTRQGHNGWYTDDFCSATLIGVVLCFTRHSSGENNEYFGEGRGKNKDIYMAGTRHSDWDGVTLDLDTTDDPMIAARWADQMAESEAEDCREEDEKYQAEQKTAELLEDISKTRTACLKLLRAWRPFRKGNPNQLVLFGAQVPKLSETLCDELLERVKSYCEEIAGYRNELKELA